jgi:16S rRNA (cytidine1402-2'-O)-methyltransferase
VAGVLYLVAAPIGNPDDVTLRAVETLGAVEIVAAEDTRVAKKMLGRLGISKRLVSYHDHNEAARAEWLVEQLREGHDVALLPDAGTPLVSDPGYRLVRLAAEEGIRVVPLPGPSAAVAALSAAGLPTRFEFVGFLPRQRGRRRAELERLRAQEATLVLYEAPHRALDTLEDALAVLGDREAVLAWNVTKPAERFFRGTLSTLLGELRSWDFVHGEMTLVIRGAKPAEADAWPGVEDAARVLAEAGVHPRVIRDALETLVDLPRNRLYERVLRATGKAAERR